MAGTSIVSPRAVVAALALAVAACGGPGETGAPAPARSAVEGLTGRNCHYVGDFETIPTLRQLTRVGTEGNISLWGRELGSADTVELSIRYGMDGRLEWVRAVRSTVDAARTRSLEAMVLGAVEGTATPDWGVRTLIVGGEVVRTEPSVICRPERVGGSGIWSLDPGSQAAYADLYERRGRRYEVLISLNDQGQVLDVELRLTTFSRWLDQYIIDNIRASTFDPKLHDGFGVASTFELNVRIPRR